MSMIVSSNIIVRILVKLPFNSNQLTTCLIYTHILFYLIRTRSRMRFEEHYPHRFDRSPWKYHPEIRKYLRDWRESY